MKGRTGIGVLAGAVVLGLLLHVGMTSKPAVPVARISTRASPTAGIPSSVARETPTTSSISARHQPVFRALTDRKEISQQDRHLRTGQAAHQLRQEHHSRPAYQHLPYRTDEVRIEITNLTSDGRVVLTVIPLGLNVNPRTAYRGFLARYHDQGSAYLAQFARYEK
jgi:hypothetical protein